MSVTTIGSGRGEAEEDSAGTEDSTWDEETGVEDSSRDEEGASSSAEELSCRKEDVSGGKKEISSIDETVSFDEERDSCIEEDDAFDVDGESLETALGLLEQDEAKTAIEATDNAKTIGAVKEDAFLFPFMLTTYLSHPI